MKTTGKPRFAILPGDGIGVDVTREAVKVLEAVASKNSIDLEMQSFDYGADRYLKTGETLPDEALENFKDRRYSRQVPF
jgi:3-isopropylmalate dehydrogenase